MTGDDTTLSKKVLSALFYAVASFVIVVLNKVILTTYGFSSQILGIGQMVTTIIVLSLAKKFQYVSFPEISTEMARRVFPLPLLFIGNLVFGLGGTQRLSLPMFTVLRRFSILMTMLLEEYMLGNARSRSMKIAVYMMIFGAIVSASNDLAFDLSGYVMVLCNDVVTALNGVYTMKILKGKTVEGEPDLNKYGMLYYNAVLMLFPALALAYATGEIDKVAVFQSWGDPLFLAQFLLGCIMGFVLMYSVVWCTQCNSALTTTVIGVLRNILVMYLGMFIGGDYIFSVINFVGLNLSSAASVSYTYLEFKSKQQPNPLPLPEEDRKSTQPPAAAIV